MAARGSTTMQFVPSEVYQSATPPSSPVVGQLWRNSAVTPNELLAWKGLAVSNARSYAASLNGSVVSFPDLSDDRTISMTVKTVAFQASGTPTPTAPLAIVGESSVLVRKTGKNLNPGVESDAYNNTNGNPVISGSYMRTMKILVREGETCVASNSAGATFSDLHCWDAYGNWLGRFNASSLNSRPAGTRWIAFNMYLTPITWAQLEIGSANTAYEAYTGVDYKLTPDATLHGLTGYEDEIGIDGHVIHKTALVTLDNTWTASVTALTTNVRVVLSKAGVAAGSADNTPAICSHFERVYSTGDTPHFYKSAGYFNLYIPKSVLSTYDAAGVLAWLQAQVSAGMPVQVLYQLATPVTATVSPARIIGAAGMNVVASDGASAEVTYTGSGWAALGAVKRVAVESVSISPEEGLRVDTVLTSADGAHQVPTFFNARGARYGLFRSSDGMMILGGLVLPNGQSAGVAGALVSPGASGETRIGIETASEGAGLARVDTAALHLVQPSFAGAVGPDYAPTGEKTPVKIEAVRGSYLNAQSQCADNFNVSLTAINTLKLITTDESGNALAWMAVERAAEGSTISTDGAYAASDGARTLSNFAPMIQMSMPTGESIVYNATARRYMPDWKTITDDYDRYGTFKGGNQSLRDVGVVIRDAGHYRFVFHADLEQASSSSGAVLYINRMPEEWTPPTTCDYVTDADLTPTRLMYRRAASAPLNASVTTCGLVADMWCLTGDKILPVVSTAAASKALVSAGTFFTAQKIG